MIVPDILRRSVAFLCYRDSQQNTLFAGTCFFLGLQHPETGGFFRYTVTAKHVVVAITQKSVDGKILIRLNKKNGGIDYYETNAENWLSHPDDPADVSILDWSPPPDGEFDITHIPTDFIHPIDAPAISNYGVGDDIFVVGLFVDHSGKNRNLPIVRAGNIAMMPEEKIPTKEFGSIDAYLIECRSIGGLSGSPVFVHLTDPRIDADGKAVFVQMRHIYLLGLIHGHYDMVMPNEGMRVEESMKKETVNKGIAIVTPSEKITDLINHPTLAETRDRDLREYLLQNPPIENKSSSTSAN